MAEPITEQEKAKEWFITQVRKRMLDYSELNELIQNNEISREEIGDAVVLAVDRYNSIDPPLAEATIWDFPSKDLLITGTIARLLFSGAILHYRNHLPYSAGGISVQTHTQGPAFERLAAQLDSKFEQQADIMKRSKNVQAMLGISGGMASQYGLLNWYNNSYSAW